MFGKLINKIGVSLSKMIDFKMNEFLLRRFTLLSEFNSGMDENIADSLRQLRTEAGKYGHRIEEFVLLLDEYSIAFQQDDADKIKNAKRSILEAERFFDLTDDKFMSWFHSVYLDGKVERIRNATYENLSSLYQAIQGYADFFSSNLDFKIPMACGRVMMKIASMRSMSLEVMLETIYMLAVIYGNVGDVNKAMCYYNKAIHITTDSDDGAMTFVALLRKWSVCYQTSLSFPGVNLDAEFSDVLRRLSDLAMRYDKLPDKLGAFLTDLEEEKISLSAGEEQKRHQFRLERINEALPMYNLLISLREGDIQTSIKYKEKLKEAEQKAYGTVGGFSNSDQIIDFFLAMFDSPHRKDSMEPTKEQEEIEDSCYTVDFHEDMLPIDRYRMALFYAGQQLAQRHYVSAGNLCDYAVKLSENLHSEYHMSMAIFMNAMVCESAGENERAANMYNTVLSVLASDPQITDVDVSPNLLFTILCNYGRFLVGTDPKASLNHLTHALSAIPSNSIIQKYHLSALYILKAECLQMMGLMDDCQKDLLIALSVVMEEAKDRLPFLDAEMREMYWTQASKPIRKVLSFVDDDSSPELKITAYNAVLLSKGVLLSAEKSMRQLIDDEPIDSPIRELFAKIQACELTQRPWGTQTDDSSAEYSKWYMMKTNLLLAVRKRIRNYSEYLTLDFQGVIDALDSRQVVVDFFDYETKDGDQQYIAFILKKNQNAPSIVRICRERDVLAILGSLKQECGKEGENYHLSNLFLHDREESLSLYDLLWRPVAERSRLKRESRVFFVPSGSLCRIPLEALPVPGDEDYTLEGLFDCFARLSHAREVINWDENGIQNYKDIVLFGGLDYGGNEKEESGNEVKRGYMLSQDKRRITDVRMWKPLLGTRKEVDDIAFLWNHCRNTPAVLLKDDKGDDRMFSELDGHSPSIIHLATHGFFENSRSSVNLPVMKDCSNPLAYAGIILADGNIGWLHGDRFEHKGVVTASEIAAMNLAGTQIVCLSACHSGEGEIRADGVFGLQRSFKMAGARCLVMSLWAESDEAGYLMMTTFYNLLLIQGKERHRAFHEARQTVKRVYQHPAFWAGFIMLD